jgi:hypothetical protein
MGRLKDLTGMKFDRLTVIERDGSNAHKKATWFCKCNCNGNIKSYIGSQLLNENTKSCGCLQKEKASQSNKKFNIYDLSSKYGVGWTTNTNKEFYFDLEDYDKIKDYCWFEQNEYIVTKCNNITLFQHRLIMDAPDDKSIDHIYHKTYDNRKSELRLCTISQNGCNMIKPSDNTSGIKGVRWHNRDCIWEAFIVVNRKYIHLGRFNIFKEAVKVRKEAEALYHGEFRYKVK